MKALLLHEGRHPIGLVIVGDEAVTHRLDVYEGARDGAIDERRVRPPAERIRVGHLPDIHHLPLALQMLDDLLVRVLDELAFVLLHLIREAAVRVQRADQRLAFLDNAVR